MSLAAEQLAREVADVRRLDLPGLEARGRETALEHGADAVGELEALPRPVGREVGLPAAEDVDVACHAALSRPAPAAAPSRATSPRITLPTGLRGSCAHDPQALRPLEPREPARLEMPLEILERERLARTQHDHGADALAEHLVRHADRGGLGDRGVLGQHGVELVGRNLHAATHDQLLEPADEPVEARVAGLGDLEQVAGAEPAVGGERGGVQVRRLEVAVEHGRPADLHFARHARRP